MKRISLAFKMLAAWGIVLLAATSAPGSTSATAAAANGEPPAEVSVGSCSGCYPTIQAGVDAVAGGGTVHVEAGTYSEQVVINKSLALTGPSASSVILQAPNSPAAFTFPESTSSWEPVLFAFGGTSTPQAQISGAGTIAVTVSGLTVDGKDRTPTDRAAGILLRNVEGTLSGNSVTNMGTDTKETFGIQVEGDSDVLIEGNTISGYDRTGIGASGDVGSLPDPHVSIRGNTVTGPGTSAALTWAPNGIQIGWGASGEIIANTVSANGYPGTDRSGSGIVVVASSRVRVESNTVYSNQTGIGVLGDMFNPDGSSAQDNWINQNQLDQNNFGISIQNGATGTIVQANTVSASTYSGVNIGYFDSFYAAPPAGSVIWDNTLSGNNKQGDPASGGIWVGKGLDGAQLSVHFNRITGNQPFGVLDSGASGLIDATYNWWGCAAGPGNPDCDVANGRVNDSPWCSSSDCGGSLPPFVDVPPDGLLAPYVQAIFQAGLTNGCSAGPSEYCPYAPTLRGQMAKFILLGLYGPAYKPPAASGLFGDVPASEPMATWIEALYDAGLASGCSSSPPRFCGGEALTRGQLAALLVRAKHGAGFTPPAATGAFPDVPQERWDAPWIEQLYRDGLTAGYTDGTFRPDLVVNRGEMAIFLSKAFLGMH